MIMNEELSEILAEHTNTEFSITTSNQVILSYLEDIERLELKNSELTKSLELALNFILETNAAIGQIVKQLHQTMNGSNKPTNGNKSE
jgi:hypothetical protein